MTRAKEPEMMPLFEDRVMMVAYVKKGDLRNTSLRFERSFTDEGVKMLAMLGQDKTSFARNLPVHIFDNAVSYDLTGLLSSDMGQGQFRLSVSHPGGPGGKYIPVSVEGMKVRVNVPHKGRALWLPTNAELSTLETTTVEVRDDDRPTVNATRETIDATPF